MKNTAAAGRPPVPSRWSRLVATALFAAALAACGGGGTGPAGPPGADGTNGTNGANGANGTNGTNGTNAAATVNVGSNAATPSAAATAAWAALAPNITVTSVSIASPPVVKFTVTDASGNPVVGLGNKSQSATATVAGLTNVAFTLAKLVPGTTTTVNGNTFSGEPSKWVSYLVTRPPTVAETTAVPATSSCNAPTAATWCGTYPTTEKEGTLVDNGDGTYQYTFYRDVKLAATVVAGLTDSANGLSLKADLGDVSFVPTATHRLGIQVGGNAPGTGSNTPNAVTSTTAVAMINTANVVYDFRPDGAALTTTRDIAMINSCSNCHDGKVLAHGSRKDPQYCVTCHTEQIKYSFDQEATSTNGGLTLTGTTAATTSVMNGRAIGNFPNLMHKMHMGNELIKTGYYYNAATAGQFNQVGLPQDPRNCTTCHTGTAITGTALAKGNQNVTPDGNNWKNDPSILACGACHDGINFATGTGVTLADAAYDTANKAPIGTTHSGHVGGPQADNSTCILCHNSTSIPIYHETLFSTPANATAQAGVSSFAYNLGSVTINGSGNAVIAFQIVKDGTVVTSLPLAPLVTNAASGAQVISPAYEPIPGFAGGPTLYVTYGVPQDNIATPADFNGRSSVALANLLIGGGSPGQGTLSNAIANGAYQADANGYFTATLTGDLVGQPVGPGCTKPVAPATATCVNTAVLVAPTVVPATAQMVTAVILGGFTQKTLLTYPYTAANVSVNPTTAASGGLATVAILKKKVATGYTARRVVVDINKCDTCHDQLGTNPSFHGGVRNDPTACAMCHTTNGVDTGWSYNASTFIHGIHAAAFRTVPYSWQSGAFVSLRYPGVLQDCNQCHVPNAVNFGASGMSVQPNLLWTTTATGTTAAPGAGTSPYISQVAGTKYGLAFQFTPAGATVAAYTLVNGTVVPAHVAAAGGDTRQAEATTLVSSPIAAACFACHDTVSDKNHMMTNGGVIYQPRGNTALVSSGVAGEACLVCHGQGQTMDAVAVHQSVLLTGSP